MGNEILLAIVLIVAVALAMFSISLVVVGIVAYKIAGLYAPLDRRSRTVPPFGRRVVRLAGGRSLPREDVEPGVNGYPEPEDEEPPDVAQTEVVTEVMGAAEGTLASDRERWWQEKRDEGYDDEEIADMEAQNVVPVFEGA